MRLAGQHADGATAARWEGAYVWASCGRALFRLGAALMKPPILELKRQVRAAANARRARGSFRD